MAGNISLLNQIILMNATRIVNIFTIAASSIGLIANFYYGIRISIAPWFFVFQEIIAFSIAFCAIWHLLILAAKREWKVQLCYIALAVLTVGTFILSNTLHNNLQRRWFVSEGVRFYEAKVRLVEAKNVLSSNTKCLDDLVGQKLVFGWTNADGSTSIEFHGRDGSIRLGYLYYTGNQVEPVPNEPDAFWLFGDKSRYFVRLTNNWYEM